MQGMGGATVLFYPPPYCMSTTPLIPPAEILPADARARFAGWSNEQLVLDLCTMSCQGDADPAELAAYEAEMAARTLDGDPYWHYPTPEQARAWALRAQRAKGTAGPRVLRPVYASVDGRFFTRESAAHAYARSGQLLRSSIREYLPDALNDVSGAQG